MELRSKPLSLQCRVRDNDVRVRRATIDHGEHNYAECVATQWADGRCAFDWHGKSQTEKQKNRNQRIKMRRNTRKYQMQIGYASCRHPSDFKDSWPWDRFHHQRTNAPTNHSQINSNQNSPKECKERKMMMAQKNVFFFFSIHLFLSAIERKAQDISTTLAAMAFLKGQQSPGHLMVIPVFFFLASTCPDQFQTPIAIFTCNGSPKSVFDKALVININLKKKMQYT